MKLLDEDYENILMSHRDSEDILMSKINTTPNEEVEERQDKGTY